MAVPPVKTVGLTNDTTTALFFPTFIPLQTRFPTFIPLQRREDKDKDMPFRMAVTSSLARATISSTFVATQSIFGFRVAALVYQNNVHCGHGSICLMILQDERSQGKLLQFHFFPPQLSAFLCQLLVHLISQSCQATSKEWARRYKF